MASEPVVWTPEQTSAVGRFAIAFGFLEAVTEGAAVHLSGAGREVAEILMPWPGFRVHRERARDLLKLRLPQERHAEIREVVRVMADLAEYRNKLLHRPVVPGTGDFAGAMYHGSLGIVTVESIDAKTHEVQVVTGRFADLYAAAARVMVP